MSKPIFDKHRTHSDELTNNITVRHPNRNVNKGADNARDNTKNRQQPPADGENDAQIATRLSSAIELPPLLNKEILTQLQSISSEACISIYMPTHPSGMAVNEEQDAIRFKSLLQDATKQLKKAGYKDDRITSWLQPAYELYQDTAFWKRQNKGLALFAGDNFCSYIHLQQAPVEKAYINKSFSLAPLIGQLPRAEYFYLLVMSKKQAKLFRADDYGMSYVPVANLPGSDVAVPWSAADGSPIAESEFYGISGSSTDTHQFFKQVNDALKTAVLNNEQVPLLLAGVDSVLPIYRSVNDYPHLWQAALTGSHEKEETGSLYAKARALMQPWFEERENKALQLYRNHSVTALASVNLAEIIPAAHYGRISHLFVAGKEPLWGSFDKETNVLNIEGTSTGSNEDLLDLTITHTLMTGGEVFYIDRRKMPERSDIAAIFRYEES
ncbi:hypothetical protein [Paraflavitalea pollutisoli]|uniref:baeRF3 domain-containing protein n=1 Tax=Paraflavitalea pollutisoli TaxID=3034143 RepID=UPI0023EA9A98|nr:hypothetical protein [Paraflavitalea sp. H1-2-19X]